MVDSLNIVALISGGKDSLYSLLHCIKNGHKVVALANLYPLESSPEEAGHDGNNGNESEEDINSFMYQTVGHSIIPLYADALRLPLYRRQITGSAIQTSREYGHSQLTVPMSSLTTGTSFTEQDETEDLMPLLQTVLRNHPEINAINTGAIQSTYQRTRVESIALRLNLMPLAYLWQYPVLPPPMDPETGVPKRDDTTTSLLDDMATAGCESRIIKIASGGIRESLLWSDVTSARTRTQLIAGLRNFFDDDELGLRGAVVGEGGEFETLALNGPKVLWRGGRIAVDEGTLRTVNGEGGASYIIIGAASVVAHDKDEVSARWEGVEEQVRVPGILDQQFAAIQTIIDGSEHVSKHDISIVPVSSTLLDTQKESTYTTIVPSVQPIISSSSVQIANVTHLSQDQISSRDLTADAKVQMQSIATLLPKLLSRICIENDIDPPLTSSAIVSTMLLLKDMSTFAEINSIYATIFEEGVPIPPARVTIAAALPEGIEVMLSVTLDRGPRQHRRGLHIQGRSYWAPANIGPYSQAVAVPCETISHDDNIQRSFEIVHVAGQIPLVPASMDLIRAGFAEQAILSLQHLWRLGQERRVDHWTAGIAFLPKVEMHDPIDARVVTAGNIWKEANIAAALTGLCNESDEEEDFDIWHLRNNHTTTEHETSPRRDGQHLRHLPSQWLNITTNSSDALLPAFVAAEVTALPRNASVEWWSTGLTGLESAQQGQVSWNQSIEYGMITLSLSQLQGTDTSLVTCLVPNTCSKEDGLNYGHIASLIDLMICDAKQKVHSEVIVTGTAMVVTAASEVWHQLIQGKPAQDTHSFTEERFPDISSHLQGLSIIPCHRLWGYKEVHVGHENREDIGVHSKQLAMALILRIDARSP